MKLKKTPAKQFSPAQIRAIKASPAGKLPTFMLKADNNKSAAYVTARTKKGAATVGFDKKAKKFYGSAGKYDLGS